MTDRTPGQGTQARSAPAERVFLDAAVTSPWHPRARAAWLAAMEDGWADARRLHYEGRRARMMLDGARESIAASLGARTPEITFASSGTHAVHLGVTGARYARSRAGATSVVSAVEQAAVLHAAAHPLPGDPVPPAVILAPVDAVGRLRLDDFEEALGPGIAVACVQAANPEVGTTQPLAQVHDLCQAAGVPLVVDAVATIGHAPVPQTWDVLVADPASWGVPGVGVLAVRAGVRWRSPEPEYDGPEKMAGPALIPAALAAAAALTDLRENQDAAQRSELIDRLRAAAAQIPGVDLPGDPEDRLPHIATFSFLYADGEALVDGFNREGFAIGSGSACTSSTTHPSHVLEAMGALTHGNIRVGLPAGVRADQVERFIQALPAVVAQVRAQLGTDALL